MLQERSNSGIFLDMTPLLAQRLRADRSFERLYRKHAGDVYRYALVVLRNEADAEDVTQTTFLNAYRAITQRGERPRQPQNWLIAIAHNVCRQRFRQSQRRPSEVLLDEELAEAVVDEDPITAGDIRRALGHLAFNQRAALVMRELEGRSYQEIAEILAVSVSAVETLIFRARRALREQLEAGITCHEAELQISRQLDGRLPRKEKGALRAHLRECDDCARFARSQRAQRGALKSLVAIPLPQSLTSLFGGGGAAVGSGLAVKAAAVGAGAVLATGVGYEGVKHALPHSQSTPTADRAVKATEHAAPQPAIPVLQPQRRATEPKPSRPHAAKAHRTVLAQTKHARPKHVHPSIPPGLAKSKPQQPRTVPPSSSHQGQGQQNQHAAKPAPKTKKAPPPTSKRHQHSPPPKKHQPPPKHEPNGKGLHPPESPGNGSGNGKAER